MATHLPSSPGPERELSLLGHLEELRDRMIRCVFAMIPALIVGYLCAPWVMRQLTIPFEDASETMLHQDVLEIGVAEDGQLRVTDPKSFPKGGHLARIVFVRAGTKETLATMGQDAGGIIYLSPTAPFMIQIQTAAVLAVVFALPYLLYQVWGFVAPGLLRNERRLALPFLVSGTLLFVVGAAFAYLTIQYAIEFLAQFVQDGAYMYNDMAEYLSFVLYTMLSFGIVFEFPLAVLVATRAGLVRREALAAQRRSVFVVLLIVAAVITPSTDPFTLMALALPLYLLFELSLLASRLMEAPRGLDEAGTVVP